MSVRADELKVKRAKIRFLAKKLFGISQITNKARILCDSKGDFSKGDIGWDLYAYLSRHPKVGKMFEEEQATHAELLVLSQARKEGKL